MAAILVTGSTGFIGSHLTRRLVEQGHRVRGLARSASDSQLLRALDVEVCEGDLMDAALMERAVHGMEYVFHLAGLTHALRSRSLQQTNGIGTRHVAQACAAQPAPPVLVYVSSVAAGGPARRHHPRTENDSPNPISNYGRSKYAGELEVCRLAGRVPSTIVRPGVVFGPGDREMLTMFKSVHRMRLHAVPGWRSPHLSVIFVADLVDLLVKAAECGRRLLTQSDQGSKGPGIYHACRPEFPDYFQFGRLLQHALDRPFLTYLHVPSPVPWLVGGVSQLAAGLLGKSTSVNIDKIREATAESWACSNHAAQRDLAFQPSDTLPAQLKATADWYLENGWL